MTGNCLKGSRPIVSFDKAFDEQPHLALLKEMFSQVFGVPRTSRKLKPFVDHIMSFYVLDGRIWIRNYQIVEQSGDDEGKMSLVEIGPRIVLKLIRIFDGSFSGTTLYSEKDYKTPSSVSWFDFARRFNGLIFVSRYGAPSRASKIRPSTWASGQVKKLARSAKSWSKQFPTNRNCFGKRLGDQRGIFFHSKI